MNRIDALLARNLGISRRDARALLAADRVRSADGRTLRSDDKVPSFPFPLVVDDDPVSLCESFHLVLHKPAGVVTALRDEQHPTAYALLEDAPLHAELRAVGRLDLDTTGLLIWTTEGSVVQWLTHPKRAVPRVYQAALARPFSPLPPELVLEDGHRPTITDLVEIGRDQLHPALLPAPDATTFARITVTGGSYHEVRRIFAALDSHVLSLCRTRYGRLELPVDLAPGAWTPISPADVW